MLLLTKNSTKKMSLVYFAALLFCVSDSVFAMNKQDLVDTAKGIGQTTNTVKDNLTEQQVKAISPTPAKTTTNKKSTAQSQKLNEVKKEPSSLSILARTAVHSYRPFAEESNKTGCELFIKSKLPNDLNQTLAQIGFASGSFDSKTGCYSYEFDYLNFKNFFERNPCYNFGKELLDESQEKLMPILKGSNGQSFLNDVRSFFNKAYDFARIITFLRYEDQKTENKASAPDAIDQDLKKENEQLKKQVAENQQSLQKAIEAKTETTRSELENDFKQQKENLELRHQQALKAVNAQVEQLKEESRTKSKEFNEMVKEKEKSKADFNTQIQSLQKQLSDQEALVKQLKEDKIKEQTKQELVRNDLNKKLSTVKEEVATQKSLIDQLNKAKGELVAENTNLKGQLQVLESDKNTLIKKVNEASEEKETLKNQLEQQKKDWEEKLKNKGQESSEEIKHLNAEIVRLKEDVSRNNLNSSFVEESCGSLNNYRLREDKIVWLNNELNNLSSDVLKDAGLIAAYENQLQLLKELRAKKIDEAKELLKSGKLSQKDLLDNFFKEVKYMLKIGSLNDTDCDYFYKVNHFLRENCSFITKGGWPENRDFEACKSCFFNLCNKYYLNVHQSRTSSFVEEYNRIMFKNGEKRFGSELNDPSSALVHLIDKAPTLKALEYICQQNSRDIAGVLRDRLADRGLCDYEDAFSEESPLTLSELRDHVKAASGLYDEISCKSGDKNEITQTIEVLQLKYLYANVFQAQVKERGLPSFEENKNKVDAIVNIIQSELTKSNEKQKCSFFIPKHIKKDVFDDDIILQDDNKRLEDPIKPPSEPVGLNENGKEKMKKCFAIYKEKENLRTTLETINGLVSLDDDDASISGALQAKISSSDFQNDLQKNKEKLREALKEALKLLMIDKISRPEALKNNSAFPGEPVSIDELLDDLFESDNSISYIKSLVASIGKEIDEGQGFLNQDENKDALDFIQKISIPDLLNWLEEDKTILDIVMDRFMEDFTTGSDGQKIEVENLSQDNKEFIESLEKVPVEKDFVKMICQHCDNEGVTFSNKEHWLKECRTRHSQYVRKQQLEDEKNKKNKAGLWHSFIPSKNVCFGLTGLMAVVALMCAQYKYNVFGNVFDNVFVPAGSSFRENVGGPLWDYLSNAYRANVDGLKRSYNTEY